MKRLYSIFIFVVLSVAGWSQSYTTTNSKAIKLYEKGLTMLYQSNLTQATRQFEQALALDSTFAECHLVLADLYLDAQRNDLAKSHYLAAVHNHPDFHPRTWILLGDMAMEDENFDSAVNYYKSLLQQRTATADLQAEARKKQATALFRREAMAHPVAFSPVNLGSAVNSVNDEYFPSLTVDCQSLIFTRRFPRRSTTTAHTAEEEDLYISHLNDGTWSVASPLPTPLNSSDNEGAQCVSQDGKILFFTACDRPDGVGRCDIYMCINRGGEWGKPRNLGPRVNSSAWESQPSFSIDGKTLYFVSDRKGGYGGKDIWKCVFEKGQWSEPVNLGPTINTPQDEMTPFVHYDDQTLYFSSNGHVGMGGMDLFCARKNADGEWQTPVNLGYPINTKGDESGLIVSPDAQTAYFSSDRPGGKGKQDIYRFQLPVEVQPSVTLCWKGLVTNAKTSKPMVADIKIVESETGVVVANTSSDALTGRYLVSLPHGKHYAIHASADGFLFYSANQSSEGSENAVEPHWQVVEHDIALHPIESGETIVLHNIFFETGSYELLSSSRAELLKLVDFMTHNPDIRIELGGHTDNVGQPADNQRLSEMRAKAVYEYLISNGIDASRLSFKGYGETKPVADNATPEGKAANRRTEIKIL